VRRLSDAQHETLAEQTDFDVGKINGWRSLPIDECTFFARCAVCVRRVRSCAVLCGRVRFLPCHHNFFGTTSNYKKLSIIGQTNNHHFASHPSTHAPLNRSPAILCH
jgi:hypothetical protein